MTGQEHHNGQVHSSLDINGSITSFDDLAKGLASGTVSRRTALRWMGGALVGAALAAVPGVAWAHAPPGNSACVRFCTEMFPPGPERGQCISQGARGSGPCYECNPGFSPAAGPYFPGCPPDQVFDPQAEFSDTCCYACEADAVLCRNDVTGNEGCYALDFQCEHTPGAGGTFDPSTCSCICPPGTTGCDNPGGAVDPTGCADLQNDRHNCGQCGYTCLNVSETAVCVNGVCVEPA